MAKHVETIGSVETIQLPELGIKDIPAKIDTGADYSSIWASNISIDRNTLHFSLFGAGSQFYTGDKLSTQEFQTTSIKNSFGVTEIRYKVKFLAAVGDRKIRAWFTLSDRSAMTYPVLVGRKFLRRKFLVDVSQVKVHSARKSKQILVLGSNPTSELTDYLEDAKQHIKDSKVSFKVRSYDDLAFIIERKNRVRIIETVTSKDVGKFDMVYFKSHKKNYNLAIAVAQYLRSRNVKFFDKELFTHVSYDKLSEYVRLALFGLPVPITVFGSREFLKENASLIVKKTGWPIVCKEIQENRGRKNYLIHSYKELSSLLDKASKEDKYLLQEFVPNNGYLRAYIFGNEAPLWILRKEHAHSNPRKSHLNKPTGSANAEVVSEDTIRPLVRDLAIRSAKLMNRQLAGVDIIQNKKTKAWFILEVNKAPQLRSGSFIDEKKQALAKFIDFELNR